MTMKCCTKLETAKERCPFVFQGHPSNFKVTRYKTSPILTQIGHFRTIGRSQLSNPSDLPCFKLFNQLVKCILWWNYLLFRRLSSNLKLLYLNKICNFSLPSEGMLNLTRTAETKWCGGVKLALFTTHFLLSGLQWVMSCGEVLKSWLRPVCQGLLWKCTHVYTNSTFIAWSNGLGIGLPVQTCPHALWQKFHNPLRLVLNP